MIESNAFRAALSALGKPAILSFKVTYQIWEADPGYWRHCEFYLFAPSLEKAKTLDPNDAQVGRTLTQINAFMDSNK